MSVSICVARLHKGLFSASRPDCPTWLCSGACHTDTCVSLVTMHVTMQLILLIRNDSGGQNTHLVDCPDKTLELLLSLAAVHLILKLLCTFRIFLIDYSLFLYIMNLRNWLEAQSGSISQADNIRPRPAGTPRSAKQTSCESTRAHEASSCEATSLRIRQGARSAWKSLHVPHESLLAKRSSHGR